MKLTSLLWVGRVDNDNFILLLRLSHKLRAIINNNRGSFVIPGSVVKSWKVFTAEFDDVGVNVYEGDLYLKIRRARDLFVFQAFPKTCTIPPTNDKNLQYEENITFFTCP